MAGSSSGLRTSALALNQCSSQTCGCSSTVLYGSGVAKLHARQSAFGGGLQAELDTGGHLKKEKKHHRCALPSCSTLATRRPPRLHPASRSLHVEVYISGSSRSLRRPLNCSRHPAAPITGAGLGTLASPCCQMIMLFCMGSSRSRRKPLLPRVRRQSQQGRNQASAPADPPFPNHTPKEVGGRRSCL